MNRFDDVIAAAAEVEAFCKARGWRFCFIGGLAVQRWGSPRFTQDVDLTLLTGFGSEEPYVDALLQRFTGRMRDARNFALQQRVALVRTAGGVDLDIALGGFSFEEGAVARATPWQVNEHVALTTCSAEDLLVHKVFAGRDRDWADVESVLIRRHDQLNLEHVRRELAPLLELKEDTLAMDRLERMIVTVDAQLRQ